MGDVADCVLFFVDSNRMLFTAHTPISSLPTSGYSVLSTPKSEFYFSRTIRELLSIIKMMLQAAVHECFVSTRYCVKHLHLCFTFTTTPIEKVPSLYR